MGQCMSPPSSSIESRDDGICVIEIVRANHLPNMDVGSLTDAYVLIHITGRGGGGAKLHNAKLSTFDRSNCLDPIFHSYQAFAFIPYDTDILTFEVLDRDTLNSDDKIGHAKISFDELKKSNGEITLELTMTTRLRGLSGEASSVTVRLVKYGPRPVQPSRKEIFVIRHGESKWNDSQAEKNIKGMISQYDHELTAQGIDQAVSFNCRWKNARDAGVDPDISTFLAAEAIFASPLTRATQTALVTCEDHPLLTKNGPGLSLLRNIREVKNFGSFDTVGRFTGQDIRNHVEDTLTKDMGAERSRKLMMPAIDCNDAVGSWWTPLEVKENKDDVRARFRDVWSFLHYGTTADIIILVGHSHFFRFMMNEYMSKGYRRQEPEWSEKLAACKLDNGACLRVTVEWENLEDPMADPVVTNARLVFGSRLIEESAHSKRK